MVLVHSHRSLKNFRLTGSADASLTGVGRIKSLVEGGVEDGITSSIQIKVGFFSVEFDSHLGDSVKIRRLAHNEIEKKS